MSGTKRNRSERIRTERNGGGTKRNKFLIVLVAGVVLVSANHPICDRRVPDTKGCEQNRSLTAFACEYSELTIFCNENESLHIEYANYGRRTDEICRVQGKVASAVNWNCSSNTSESKVQEQCKGKTECNVSAINEVFGDPCPSTPKYLAVIHRCYPGNATYKTPITSLMDSQSTTTVTPTCPNDTSGNDTYKTDSITSLMNSQSSTTVGPSVSSWVNDSSGNTKFKTVPITSSTVSQSPTTSGPSWSPSLKHTSGNATYKTDPITSLMDSQSTTTVTPIWSQRLSETSGSTTYETDPVTSSTASLSTTTAEPTWSPCPNERKRNIDWASNYASIVSLPCPNNPNTNASRRECGTQGAWITEPDLSECISQEVLELKYKLANLTNMTHNLPLSLVHDLMDGLEKVTQSGDLYGGDLVLLAKVMVGAIALPKSNVTYEDADKITEVVLKSTSALLGPKVVAWLDLPSSKQSSTATTLLHSVETSSALLARSTNQPRNIDRNATGLVVRVMNKPLNRLSTSFGEHDLFSYEDKEAANGSGLVTVALFDNITQWLHVTNSSAFDTDRTSSPLAENASCLEAPHEIVVNTRVMQISVVSRSEGGESGHNETVKYTLQHIGTKENDSVPVCVFWKYSKETFEGSWSSDGCRDVSNCTDCNYTVCECNHLTNFAVLMSVSNHTMSKGHMLALSVITYVGCMISIVCLALAFITFYWFKGLQCDRNTIHKNLVLCLFISEVIFLLGIVQFEHRQLCAVVAGFLHYFFLASFSWMLLEGIQLYVLLIEVFEAEKSRLRWYYLGAYGAPAIIVFISAVTTYARGHPYATTDYCWLSKEAGLMWAFTGPVAIIIFVNSIMLGVAIHTMCKHTSTATSWKLKQKSKIDTIGSWVRGAVVLMILLGSTWTFGFLYIDEDTLFMAYIFTILNSLQGVFIFVFHCVTNEKVQKEYRRCIQRWTWLPEDLRVKYGGLSGSAALSTTPNQSNSSGVPTFFRMLRSRKRNHSLSSSSFQKSSSDANKKGNVLVVISPPGEGGSSTSSHRVKRHASSTSESARLTDSSGVPSSDYLYDDDDPTEAPSGYLDAVITRVDENEFNGPDLIENSAMEESFIITDRRDHRR